MSGQCRSHSAGPRCPSVFDVLSRYHDACLDAYGDSMRTEERKALQSILLCRTPVMGGRSYRCSHCDKDHFAWHSCNHRLCPICGSAGTRKWVADKLENRLPVPYYMVTFTLPQQLRWLSRYEAKRFLPLFLASSAQAIKDVLKEPRHLGGECGFIGALQTWTQDLRLHPHVHYIVPAVGLDKKGRLKRPKKEGWLARGEIFASRMKTLLLKAIKKESLLARDQIEELWAIDWNCDVQNFGDGTNALKYVGGYVCKGPISDSRILGVENGMVIISVKDRKSGERKPVAIKGPEFVSRYLQHALPSGFHSIRYHGFLHPRSHKKLASIRKQLGARPQAKTKKEKAKSDVEPMLCPRCRKPMELTAKISRAPPNERSIPNIWLRGRKAAA